MSIGINYGSEMVALSDTDIEKQNRLFTLKKVHSLWLKKQDESKGTEEKEKQQTEGVMAKKNGDCVQCGKKGVSVRGSYGRDCCATCASLRSSVKNNPDVVRAALTEFHGTMESGRATEKYDELQERNQFLCEFNDELTSSVKIWEDFFKSLMSVVLPAVDHAAVGFYEYRDGLPGTVASRFVAYDDLRSNADGVKRSLSMKLSAPDSKIKDVIYKMLGPGDGVDYRGLLFEISEILELDAEGPEEVVDGVRDLEMVAAMKSLLSLLGLEHLGFTDIVVSVEALVASTKYYQEDSDRLREALQDSEKQVTELTNIVAMPDAKSERRDQVLDIALAVIRDEGHVVADKLEMLRFDGVA